MGKSCSRLFRLMGIPQKKLPQVVLFGDSLTEWSFEAMRTSDQDPQIVCCGASISEWSFRAKSGGFGWVMREKYAGKAEVLNEGKAGYTSTRLLPEYREILARASQPHAAPVLLLTIFVGANDACFISHSENYVPLDEFESNLRTFVEEILISNAPALASTKIALLSTPPINIPTYPGNSLPPQYLRSAAVDLKKERGYRTYISKKTYADKVMEVAGSYAETGRVVGVHVWKALVDAGLEKQGRGGEEEGLEKGQKYEERLPGCGLEGAVAFPEGWFVDGLHFGEAGYDVVTKALLETVWTKWPDLAPERITGRVG